MRRPHTMARSRFVLTLSLLTTALGAGACLATDQSVDAGTESELIARVSSIEITEAQVEEALAAEFQRIAQERHEILERGMEEAIDGALLDLDAAAQGISKDDLLERISADVSVPTEADIEAFYEARKARINRPKEEVAGQIRNYLVQQSQQGAYSLHLKGLKERYEVRRFLEPIRFEVGEGGGPAMGPEGAPVTIVEFSDFQCPYCQRHAPTIDRIKQSYGDQVRVVFRQFPLPIHDNAQKAAEASLCAAEKGKFWEMHDAMFVDIRALGVEQLKETAAALSLDAASFGECLDSGKYAAQVAQDLQAGRLAGVTGTPAMFINGRFLSGAVPYEDVAAVIDDELQREGASQ